MKSVGKAASTWRRNVWRSSCRSLDGPTTRGASSSPQELFVFFARLLFGSWQCQFAVWRSCVERATHTAHGTTRKVLFASELGKNHAKGSKTGDTVEDHVQTTTQLPSTQRQLRIVTSDASSSPRRVARASRGKTLVCQRRVVPPWPMGSMARELTALASPTIFFFKAASPPVRKHSVRIGRSAHSLSTFQLLAVYFRCAR